MRHPPAMETMHHINLDQYGTLRYLKIGTGKPLLLLHTIRTQLEYFQAVFPALAKHYTIYALDLPGHGQSSIDTQQQYDEPYLREALIAFIEQLALREVTLVGESIGAVLALTVAASLPDHVIKVISCNPYDDETRYADGVRRGNLFSNLVLANYAVPIHGAIFAFLENWLFLGLVVKGGLKQKRWMPNRLLGLINRTGYRKGYRYVERNVFKHWQSWANARAHYANVKAPVVLIYGDHDWSTHAERQRTATALGNPTMMTLENTGHFSFVDQPEKLRALILENA